jgi:chromosome segregation and condensation protein ScpB
MASTIVALQTELPASTVSAILHQVEDYVDYTYNELSAMYQSGHLKIEVVAEGYLVTISDQDGVLDSILISNL